MSLQFMLVKQTKQNKSKLIEQALTFLEKSPNHQVFYITPNHMKFEMELTVLQAVKELRETKTEDVASMRLGIYSFQRLDWFLRQENNSPQTFQVSDIGNMMVIRKILQNLKAELTFFKGEVAKEGFVEKLAQLFKELETGNIHSLDLLQHLAQKTVDEDPLQQYQKNRLEELSQIYSAYEAYMLEHKIDIQSIYDDLLIQIAQQNLENVMVIIDGFYRFNAGEKVVISALLEKVVSVHVVLDLDKPYIDKQPAWYELFNVTGTTYYDLYHYARDHQIPILKDAYGEISSEYCNEMVVLDRYFQEETLLSKNNEIKQAITESDLTETVYPFKAQTTYLEMQEIANRIYQYVSVENYRYQDIQILTRDFDSYRQSLIPELKKNNIPFFIDEVEAMEKHPLARMLRALYRIQRYNWRYEDVFDFLRSELFIPEFILTSEEGIDKQFREMVDLAENVVLKNGYEGQYWWQPQRTWTYLFVDENGDKLGSPEDIKAEYEANRLRRFLSQKLLDLFAIWDIESNTKTCLQALYQFLIENKVRERLMVWRDEWVANGELEKARHHEQAWQTFVNVIDEYVYLYGEETFDSDQFFALIATGFKEATYSIVPPTMDSVRISNMDSQRVHPKKITFVIGLNQSALPKTYQQDSLLTTEDREWLQTSFAWGQSLSPSLQTKHQNERFIAYKTFLSATEKLVLSYAYNNEKGVGSLPSQFLTRVCETFNLPIIKVALDTQDKRLGNWKSQVNALMEQIALSRGQHINLAPKWQRLYWHLQNDPQAKATLQSLLPSVAYQNKVMPLTKATAEKLYGKNLSVSVSQLELYNRDPFSYFLMYGLKLRERPVFELDPLQTGNYYHAVLDYFFSYLNQQHLALRDVSEAQCQEILQLVVAQLRDIEKYPEFTIFSTSALNRSKQERMVNTLAKQLIQMQKQNEQIAMQTVATEKLFGFNQTNEWVIPLPDDSEVRLRGKIDRIDWLTADDTTYVQVVDYKSSENKLQFDKILSGRQLQLFTYLLATMHLYDNQQAFKPFGAFYQTITDGFIRIKEQSEIETNLADKQLSKYQLSGFVRGDIDLLSIVDEQLARMNKSLVYPVQLKKDGSFYRASQYFSEEEYQQVLAYTLQQIKKTAMAIKSGRIDLHPYDDDKSVPSIYSSYRNVSFFDATDVTNRYRISETIKDKQSFFNSIAENDKGENDG